MAPVGCGGWRNSVSHEIELACLQHLRLRGCCSSYIELYTTGNETGKKKVPARTRARARVCTRNFYDKSRAMSFESMRNPRAHPIPLIA